MTDLQTRCQDPARTIDDRVEALLEEMNLDEKIAQLGCLWSTALVKNDTIDADFIASVESGEEVDHDPA